MKKSIKNVLCAGALFATLTLTSCGSDGNEVKNVEVKSNTQSIVAGDNFDYSGLTLEVTTKNNKKETVKVTEEMIISKPDLTTAGEKVIKVKYKGEEYSIKIYVNPNINAYYNKLANLLEKIKTDKTLAKEITFKINANAGANYFGDNFNLISFDDAVTLSDKDIKNSDLMKALASLGISVDKASIKTENYNLYLTVDKVELVKALNKIIDTYKNEFGNIAQEIGKEYVVDKASIIVDLAVNALGCVDENGDVDYIKTSLRKVFKQVVKGTCDEGTFSYLVSSICEARGMDGKQAEKVVKKIMRNANWFENSVELIVNDDTFKKMFETKENVIYNAVCNSLKEVAIELDNLKNGQSEQFAKKLVANLPTLKIAMGLYVKYVGDETAKRAYANFEKYVEPFISETNINSFIADLKGLKDLTFEKMDKMFKSFIKQVVSGEIVNKAVEALNDFLASEAGIEVASTFVSERIENWLFVAEGSTTLKADIKAFLVKEAQNDDSNAELRQIVVTIANAMGQDGEFYGNLFQDKVVDGNEVATFIDVLNLMGYFNVYVPNSANDGYDIDKEESDKYYNTYRNFAIELDKDNTDETRTLYSAIANVITYEFESAYKGEDIDFTAIKGKLQKLAEELDKYMLKVESSSTGSGSGSGSGEGTGAGTGEGEGGSQGGSESSSAGEVAGETGGEQGEGSESEEQGVSQDLIDAFTAFASELSSFMTANGDKLDAEFVDDYDTFVKSFGAYLNVDNFIFIMDRLKQYQNMEQKEIMDDLMENFVRVMQSGEFEQFVSNYSNFLVESFLKNKIENNGTIYEGNGDYKQYVKDISAKVKEFVMTTINDAFTATPVGGEGSAEEGEEETPKPTIKENLFKLLDDVYAIINVDGVKEDYPNLVTHLGDFKDIVNCLFVENATQEEIEHFTLMFGQDLLRIDMTVAENASAVSGLVQSLRTFTLTIENTVKNPQENGLITGLYAFMFIGSLDNVVNTVENGLDEQTVTTIHRVATSMTYIFPLIEQISSIYNGEVPTGTCTAISNAIFWIINPYFDEDKEFAKEYAEIIDLASATDALLDTRLKGLQEVVDNYFESLDAFMVKYGDMLDADVIKEYQDFNKYIKPMFIEKGVTSITKWLPILSESTIAEIIYEITGAEDVSKEVKDLVVGNVVSNLLNNYADKTKSNIFVDTNGNPRAFVTEITNYVNEFYDPMLGLNLYYPINGETDKVHTAQEVITAFKNDVGSVLRRDDVKSNFVDLDEMVDKIDLIVDGIFNKDLDLAENEARLNSFKNLVAKFVKIKEVDGVFDADSMGKLSDYIDQIRTITTVTDTDPATLMLNGYSIVVLMDKVLQETQNDFDAEATYQIHKYAQTLDMITPLILQIFNIYDGNLPTNVSTALINIYCWATDADRVTDEDGVAYIKALKELAKSFDRLTTTQIGEMQKAIKAYVTAVEGYYAICGENMSEIEMAQYQFIENVLKPLAENGVIDKVTNYLPLLKFNDFTSIYNSVLKKAFADLGKGDNSALIDFGVRNFVAGMLVPFATNEYAIMDDFEEVQPEVEELLDYVVDFVLNEDKDYMVFANVVMAILQKDYFAENFTDLNEMAKVLSTFGKLVASDAEMTSEEQQILANEIQTVFKFAPKDAEATQKLAQDMAKFFADIKTAEDKINAVILGLDELLQGNENQFDEKSKQYLHMISESYRANQNYESVSNFFKLSLKANEKLSENEINALIKMGEIIDYFDEQNADASNVDILELISMKGFTDILTNNVGLSEQTVMLARVLMYVLIDVDEEAGESVDYNELMKDLELPSQYASVDYNELIAELKARNLNNMLEIEDAKVTTMENEQGDIVSEKVSFKVKFNFDALVGNLYADLDIDMILSFEDAVLNA